MSGHRGYGTSTMPDAASPSPSAHPRSYTALCSAVAEAPHRPRRVNDTCCLKRWARSVNVPQDRSLLQCLLQQTRGLVLDVIHPDRTPMFVAEEVDPAVQVGAFVADNRPGYAGLGRGGFQLLIDHLAIRVRHRLQVDQRDILVAQDAALRPFPGRLAKPPMTGTCGHPTAVCGR